MITFNGIKGQIIEKSPHGNYLVVELTNEVTICGTFSNIWNWEENPEIESGFISFITYIGVDSTSNLEEIYDLISKLGGYFKENEETARASKRNRYYPLELKVRGIKSQDINKLALNYLLIPF